MKRTSRAVPDLSLEAETRGPVAGIDEAGRGPLAGPVVAAALVFLAPPSPGLAGLLDDSKRLPPAARERAAAALREAAAQGLLAFALGAASAEEIGRLNILHATYLAMQRAVARLRPAPDMILIDGHRGPCFDCAVRCVVGGDGISLSIAAASILAKVERDAIMCELSLANPGYGWEKNAGYPSPGHLVALAQQGVTPHHRRSFAPVRKMLCEERKINA